MQKHTLLALFLALVLGLSARADEGMWLPSLLAKINQADMQARGFKLTADDIYNVNRSSLKDAVLLFNGGCTAEIIGREGLILTNHHCGYGQIQAHSKVGRNLLDDGFWAMSKADELPNPGTTAARLVRMEDVTSRILPALDGAKTEAEREAKAQAAAKALADLAVQGTGYAAQVKPFYYGAEYYLFVYEVFRDVRLVGAPPSGIGKFGGDTDNWMWPRHTGDFSLFRIYTAPDGSSVEYSTNNVPYKPLRVLELNVGGIKEGDFSMVMGFPGRTQEYLPSYAIENIARYSNPYKISLRTKRLAAIDAASKASEEVRIQYAAKYASIANAWKKWQGESRGLARLHVIERKRAEEVALTQFIATDPERQKRYGYTLKTLENAYQDLNKATLPFEYYREAVLATELLAVCAGLEPVRVALEEKRDFEPALKTWEQSIEGFYKNYNPVLDEKIAMICMNHYLEDIPIEELSPQMAGYKNANGAGSHELRWVEELYDKSRLTGLGSAQFFASEVRMKGLKVLNREPAFKQYRQFMQAYTKRHLPAYQAAMVRIEPALRDLTALRRMREQVRNFYPDANLTLRLTYGPVGGYRPLDGTVYKSFTYIDGVIEKRDTTVEEFNAPKRLVELWRKKEYGRYADASGKLPLAFVAANHTTGGNSGSPVLDGNGRLIGTNFDRCWEGTMSDLAYDPKLCRNIAVDIRYTLWTIDKFAGAGYLLNEMTLVK